MTLSRLLGFRGAVVAIIAMAALSGWLHGTLDGRWGSAENITESVVALDNLPTQIGDWTLVEKEKLPESAERILRCHHYVVYQYRHANSGNQLNLAILFGPRGPISVHTPEVCYPGQGIQPEGGRTAFEVKHGDSKHSFWTVGFTAAGTSHSKVTYAWSDGGIWVAAKYPRVWPTANLYKIQVASSPNTDDGEDFLKAFMPIWDTHT